MKIKVNLKGSFRLVPEGERKLRITEVKVTPSGKPNKMTLKMEDVEDGSSLMNSYNFDNETSLWAMGQMLNAALGTEDGDEFDTSNANDLVGIVLLCEVKHSEYNDKTYANIHKVISRVDDDDYESPLDIEIDGDLD